MYFIGAYLLHSYVILTILMTFYKESRGGYFKRLQYVMCNEQNILMRSDSNKRHKLWLKTC